MKPLVGAGGVSKSYGGVRALKNASFSLMAGEIHALVGENGAGKSTLIRILAGATQADSGSIEMDGRRVEIPDPNAAKALGIAVIYQQPALFPDLSIEENIGLALETGGLWRRIDWGRRRRKARELLSQIGSDLDPRRIVAGLSMPEQQLVEIAKALGARARVLILDEPTASLAVREVEALFGVLRQLRSGGVGLIYVSHRLEELPAIADRVTVLRDGLTLETRAMAEVDRAELIRMMVGRELEAEFPKREVAIGETVLEVRGLTSRSAGIRGVDLKVRAGEIVGLAGLIGAGRTELAETLFGLHEVESGEVTLRGRPVRAAAPEDAVRAGIGYVPEDRRRHGLVMSMPVAANVTLAALAAQGAWKRLDTRWEKGLAQDFVRRLEIKTPSVEVAVKTLSGGTQQKVCLSRWMAARPALMILDEPTQGVDVGAKAEIHRLMARLAAEGMAILMISSEMPEVLGMSDRVVVMRRGAVAGELGRSEATQERVLSLALGAGGEA